VNAGHPQNGIWLMADNKTGTVLRKLFDSPKLPHML